MKKESAAWKAWPAGKRVHGLLPAKYHQSNIMVLTGERTEQMETGLLRMLHAVALLIPCWCCTLLGKLPAYTLMLVHLADERQAVCAQALEQSGVLRLMAINSSEGIGHKGEAVE